MIQIKKTRQNQTMSSNNKPLQGRRIEQQVMGQATRDGDGVKLTRVLTQAHQRRLDPFLMTVTGSCCALREMQ